MPLSAHSSRHLRLIRPRRPTDRLHIQPYCVFSVTTRTFATRSPYPHMLDASRCCYVAIAIIQQHGQQTVPRWCQTFPTPRATPQATTRSSTAPLYSPQQYPVPPPSPRPPLPWPTATVIRVLHAKLSASTPASTRSKPAGNLFCCAVSACLPAAE